MPVSSPTSRAPAAEPVRVWMEHGFSRREIAPRMLRATSQLEIVSSTRQPVEGTEALDFPSAGTADAIGRINSTIRAHAIDAVWVQDSARYDLSAIEADVHAAADPKTIRLVDDKTAFNEWLGKDAYRPFSLEAVGVDAIRAAYERRRREGHEVCIKPVFGVNGEGYWRLSDSSRFSVLNHPDERVIHPEAYLTALTFQEQGRRPRRMVLMDYLPGPEVSVDVLMWWGKPLSHAARTKLDSDHQRIESDHEVVPHARRLARTLRLHGIVSLQYRRDAAGAWKILEINPRPAGGSVHSDDAGFAVVADWARLVAGEIGPADVKQHEASVVHTKRVRT
ncbi:ATP-grasp domain-containing protein [Microbacterium sp.]|uniref:ATP-grasp domain-containing protein n=1 Tax=Microbacterium sp. TaxID=51671 RepID=UPI003C794B98